MYIKQDAARRMDIGVCVGGDRAQVVSTRGDVSQKLVTSSINCKIRAGTAVQE